MPTGNNIQLIHASQGVLTYKTSASALNFANSLVSLITTANEQVISCKNVSIKIPETESTQVALLGTEATTRGTGVLNTGVFQNAMQDFGNTGNAEISGTLALTMANDGNVPTIPDFVNLASGVGQLISTTHHRHTFGDSTAAQTQVLSGVIFLAFDNGVKAGVVCLVNPTVNLTEIKPTGADGHWEVDFKANTLPKFFAWEIEDSD